MDVHAVVRMKFLAIAAGVAVLGAMAVPAASRAKLYGPYTSEEAMPPPPRANCKVKVVPAPKYDDVAVGPSIYWDCPDAVPMLKQYQARKAAKGFAVHLAASMDEDTYAAGVLRCKRESRTEFYCRTYVDSVPHMRCTQRVVVWNSTEGAQTEYVTGSTRCARSSKAKY